MGKPYFFNVVTIKVQQLREQDSYVDPDFREAVGGPVFGEAIELKGQVNFGFVRRNFARFKSTERYRTGDAERAHGQLIFKTEDLERLGVTLHKGDVVTEVGGSPFDLEINELWEESYLNGKAMLLYCGLTRRHERRESK